MIKFDVLDIRTGKPKFTAELDCSEDLNTFDKLGLAVQWAVERKVSLAYTDLAGARLQKLNLRGVSFRGANLNGANLAKANMRGINLVGASLINAQCFKTNFTLADLCAADFEGANLVKINLHGAYMVKANLTEANLQAGNLTSAYIVNAKLTATNLTGVNFTSANLSGSLFRRAVLWDVIGNGVELKSCQCGRYSVVLHDDRIQIGCENHTIKQWFRFTKAQISEMDSGALEWWTVWKPVIKQLVEVHSNE